jgi:hypothetical protein
LLVADQPVDERSLECFARVNREAVRKVGHHDLYRPACLNVQFRGDIRVKYRLFDEEHATIGGAPCH